MTYREMLHQAAQRLDDPNPQEAFFLMVELGRSRHIDLYSHMDDQADEVFAQEFLERLERLAAHEPLAYILGFQPFYGRDFIVDERVLIPRPETEELCSLVLSMSDELFDERPLSVFDIACGSGAIGLTLDLEDERMDVFASDLSEQALEVARQNNKALGGHTIFLQGDLAQPFIDRNMKCDILLCNPPYIPNQEEIDLSVKDYEPSLALFGGEDGMDLYRSLFEQAGRILNDQYLCAFEMGWNQGETLEKLARQAFPQAEVRIHQDLSGKDRMLTITNIKKGADNANS